MNIEGQQVLTGVTLPNVNQLSQHEVKTSLSPLSTAGEKLSEAEQKRKKMQNLQFKLQKQSQDRGKGKQCQQIEKRRRGQAFLEIILDLSLNLIY